LTKNIKTIIASGQDNIDVLNETKACIEKKSNRPDLPSIATLINWKKSS
jgi:hypothetical protein